MYLLHCAPKKLLMFSGSLVYFLELKILTFSQSLIEKQFLSCPVVEDNDGITYYGFVDVLDFLHYFINEKKPELWNDQLEAWQLLSKSTAFGDKKISDVIDDPTATRNVFHPITVGYSLYIAFEALAREENLHR
jgi:hypothetical protein